MKPSNMFGLNPASHSSPNLIAAIRPLPRRAQTAPPKAITGRSSGRPDYVLTFCYMLVYLEVGWLFTLLWRSYVKPGDWLA